MSAELTWPERIAVVNRGEPAVRLVRAVRELAAETGLAMRSIALHTPAEASARFVRDADESVRLEGDGSTSPYLDLGALEQALRAARADAAWVGWGFVAERPEFVELCDRMGITFVGPSAEVMARLGDKVAAKLLAESVGVPVAPWSGGPVTDAAEALEHAQRIGVPLMIKAAAGGGGRGIRVVEDLSDLDTAVLRAREEAQRSFGDPTVFLERRITDARHVEVQILADGQGGAWACGVRDCTIQRRNQKLWEESASPVLDAQTEADLARSAADLVLAAGYKGAGTVEFLHRPSDGTSAFLEVNTRLQVEHPVTEAVTSLDLVKAQLAIAAGGRLEGDPPPPTGHAIEVRLNAEDPDRDWAPAPGRIVGLTLPSGPGIRVDSGIAEGDVIPPEYDSMIAKVIAWGRDRDESLSRMRRALAETSVLVDGGTTNRAFLARLAEHPAVVEATADTGWLDRDGADIGERDPVHAAVALVTAAITAFDAHAEFERSRFLAAAARGRPTASADVGAAIDLREGATTHRLLVARTGPRRYYVRDADGASVVADIERLGRAERRITIGGRVFRVTTMPQGADHLVEVEGTTHRISADDAGIVRAGGPGLVVALLAAVGDEVTAGTPVAVLESMKMETALVAPFTGTVTEHLTVANTQVDAGAALIRLEPSGDTEASEDGAHAADLAILPPEVVRDDATERAGAALDAMRRLVLGYDVPAEATADLVASLEEAAAVDSDAASHLLSEEIEILAITADLAALSRGQRIGDEDDLGERRAAREHLHAYLRSLDAEAEGLPPSFTDKLHRALTHYGITSLERTPELEEAVWRIHLAGARSAVQVPAIIAILERRLRAASTPDGECGRTLRDTLDRLIRATQVRQPVIGDLARQARHRSFTQPRLDAARADEIAEVHRRVGAVAAADGALTDDDVTALVAAGRPLLGILEDPRVTGSAVPAMLEVLTRRYYRRSTLADSTRLVTANDLPAITMLATDARGASRVIAVAASHDRLAEAVADAEALTDDLPEGIGAVADIYLTGSPRAVDADALAARMQEALVALDGSRIRRFTCSVTTSAASGDTAQDVQHLTFRLDDGGVTERRHLRGIHPMIASRLDLWRLAEFDLTRLGSDDDVYLFRCVARDNPTDERLFAMAEVRDLTPSRGPDGRVTALPELERVFAAAIADLRRARASYAPGTRPEWNRIIMSVWPTVDVPVAELDPVIRALAPLTEDLGLEQVMVQARLADAGSDPVEVAVRMSRPPGRRLAVRITDPPAHPLRPLDDLTQRVVRARRRGTVHPTEIIPMITHRGDAAGTFTEHDLDAEGRLVPVERPPGRNTASVVVGVVSTPVAAHPDGMRRVAVLGDPTRGLGSLAGEECSRIAAAIDLAAEMDVPIEWFAVSSGARIAMDSGTENMDAIGLVLRRIVTHTQRGGEINVVVTGINVGAQPYWNAEATMLMHTRGTLIMTPDSAMVLTGKQALDYSGGVSAEDNFGIGGYDRVMGPNGQAQHWAQDLSGAVDVLFAHYERSYRAPGERFPRQVLTTDPVDRDVCIAPHDAEGFATIGEIFDTATNPDRKRPFDVRCVIRAVVDADHPPLERWADMASADTAVTVDAHLGGHPVAVIGFESHPVPRRGFHPADGPDTWSAGTLFPRSSYKTARMINAASGNRPLVVLANLSGFDGSPESLRSWQLEHGAEIGRAIVNFDGPIAFCVVSRYHGGAFVVFSKTLNDHMEVAAVEGSRASVIGGPPAAATVFGGQVNTRTAEDPRVRELAERAAKAGAADEAEAARIRAELEALRAEVRSEKLGEVAAEFDAIHSVERAREVGSIDTIIEAGNLRPYLIDAIERGMARFT